MKFLLILPLLISTAISTIFAHRHVHKDHDKSKLLTNGLINSHFKFLGHKTPELSHHITDVQNVNTPTNQRFSTHFRYPYYIFRYPAHQSSGFISQAPISTHSQIVGGGIPIHMANSPYDSNPTFTTQSGSIVGANYGRDDLDPVVKENIKKVFTEEKIPHNTGAVIEKETISSMSNVGGGSSYQTNAYSELNTPFVNKIPNQETIGVYPNTKWGQIRYPSEALGSKNYFQGGESSLGSGQFNTGSSSGPGGLVYQNVYLGGEGSLGRGQVYPTGSELTTKDIKNTFVAYPNSGLTSRFGYSSTNLKENAVGNLPLAPGQLSNGVRGQHDYYTIKNQSPFPGSGFSQLQTVFAHYNQPSQPWIDYYRRFPIQFGVFQRYPDASQHPSQMESFQRYPLLDEGTGQYLTASGVYEHYAPQAGASQLYPSLGAPNRQFVLMGGENGQYHLHGGPFQLYPSLSGAYGQFLYAGGVNGAYFPPREVKNAQFTPRSEAFGQSERNPSKTGGHPNSRLKENSVNQRLVSLPSRIKEDAPEDNATKIETEEKTEREIINKGLISIKAPPVADVEGTKTEEVIQKGLIAIEAPSSGEVRGDVKNEEAVPYISTKIEGTKTEEVVQEGIIAVEVPSIGEMEGDVRNEEVTHDSPTNIEAAADEAPPAAGVESTKTDVVVAVEAPSSGEVEGDVKAEGNVQNEPTDMEAPDNKVAVNTEVSEDAESIIEKQHFEENLVDAEKPHDKDLAHESINEPNEDKANTSEKMVGGAKSGPEKVDTVSVDLPSKTGKVIGEDHVSEMAQRSGVSEKKVDQVSDISLDPVTGGTESDSKIQIRDTTSVLGEPRTISFTIHLPPKTITTKTVSQVIEHKTKDGKEVNVVPIQRTETVEQKSGSNGYIEPTLVNGPNGVHITFGNSGNIGMDQQGGDLTNGFDFGSILGIAQAMADGKSEQSGQSKPE